MSIEFTQFLMPNGRRQHIEVDRPKEIEQLAHDFIKRGGWFECEVLSTGHVSLTACFNTADGPDDIAIRVIPNGPEVNIAVDELVLEAQREAPSHGRIV